MPLTKPAAFAVLALTCASAAPLAAQSVVEQGLAPLLQAFGSAAALRPSPALRALAVADAEAEASAASDSLFSTDGKAQLPAPDAATLAYLVARIPDLSAPSVRVAPEQVLEEAVGRAAARSLTFMDLLTDSALRRGEVYYASAQSLQSVYAKYDIGILPASGVAKDGRPFRMVAALGGQGRVAFLYDRTDDFEFDGVGRTFKISGGRVSGVIAGPGVIDQMQGLAAQGCWGPFCKWANFMKWQKIGPTRVHLWANAGGGFGGGVHEQDIDLAPVHPK